MGSIIKHFEWCLSDINLCLSSSYYSTNSSKYTTGDSVCTFYLRFRFDGKVDEVSVFLCRNFDGGPPEIKLKCFISLQTVDGDTLHAWEESCSFLNGGNKCFSTNMRKEKLVARLANDQKGHNLLVICQTVLLDPSFSFLYKGIEDLSANLLELRSESSSANAHLIAGEEKIPVHKEILSARSPVFQKTFKTGNCYFDKQFPAVIIKAMLDFLYSGDIRKIDLSSLNPEQLYACALHYGISDLINLLTPRKTFSTSIVCSKSEVHYVHLPNFKTLCRTLDYVEHHGIKMLFNEDIEMSVKVLFGYYNKDGKIRLQTTLWNISNIKSIFVQLFILDNSGERRYLDKQALHPENNSITFFSLFEPGKLFSANSVPTEDILLNYELKFWLKDEFRISDPEIQKEYDFSLLNHEVTYSLITNMKSLLRSKQFADAVLVPSSVESNVPTPDVFNVHKSILSARSPVFKDMFRTGQKISVNFSTYVVQHLLHYVYTGYLLSLEPAMLNLLHAAAEKYRIDPLKYACKDSVATMTLNIKNISDICSIAGRAGLSELEKSCIDFAVENLDILIGSFEWEKLRTGNKKAFEEIKSKITTKS